MTTEHNHSVLSDVLSITAIVLSAGSLGWQVASWRRSGAVVVVTATQAMPTYGHGPSTTVGDPHVLINAANKGRSPVTVKGCGLRLPDGQTMAILEWPRWSTPLPHRLEPGADGSWFIDTKSVRDCAEAEGVRYQDLIAYVTLGDGRTIEARRAGIGWK